MKKIIVLVLGNALSGNSISNFLIILFFLNILLFTAIVYADTDNDMDAKKTYSFGVVPQQSAMVLAKKWIPIFKYLEKETGYKFVFKTNQTIPKFEHQLSKQAYDFAYMNPYHYTVFHDVSGYSAFAKQGQKKLKGIIIARKDSTVKSLEDLEGKTIAFPAPAAFAATVVPQAILNKRGIKFKSKYVSSHESVYKNVNYQNFEAGGGIERTFNNASKDITQPLTIIWTTEGYTPHAFASSSKIPKEVSMKVQKALMNLSNTAEGKILLKGINFKSIVTAQNSDWNDVRALDIQILNNLKSVSSQP
ncbi:phosphate/phosphite/phosphonate ABC transporter substrate-binding protein [Thiomicrorhabdus lithotrophica]|uniref:Phosphate/phosphite/phosphonate ABC transporter substrate-binding protein n=1 Tax=Thiomicrorhabdus lithotrophica TaxID=2949997 RepID=A0ABY8C7A6_9GAMM|nr:phosphate/phosphite/phosphonate ABC transporter substrate-binding protein [Thiomicrorhabdus lithotrophica]WEJ61835.1 phosphate/phosphite/phosphonate ABC transporter substrate-binding protein [Thiomicrorhabdus lithotrophica]